MEDIFNPRQVMKPPVVKGALSDAFLAKHPTSALAPHIADLERLMMVNSSAPSDLDAIPFGTTLGRFSTLVAVARAAYAANPDLGGMIRQIGPALQADRAARGGPGSDKTNMTEAVREVLRAAEAPTRSYQPRY